MATLNVQGTKFTFSILATEEETDYFAKVKIAVENEFISYEQVYLGIAREEIEGFVFALSRLLAGAYGQEYNVTFEKAGIAADLYPYTLEGKEVTREERRRNDARAIIRFLMRSKDKKRLLGGVYSVLLHKKEIEFLAAALTKELDKAFERCGLCEGEYLFVGVSPKGFKGCNYWYYDPTGSTKRGDYVWVRMGRHNTEQIVYVDSVRYFTKDSAPYDPESVKQILRKASVLETLAKK